MLSRVRLLVALLTIAFSPSTHAEETDGVLTHVTTEDADDLGSHGYLSWGMKPWTDPQPLGLGMARIAGTSVKIYFEPYWGDAAHPEEPAIVEVNYREDIDRPVKVLLHDGSRYRLLGVLGGTAYNPDVKLQGDVEDKPWAAASFFVPADRIGATKVITGLDRRPPPDTKKKRRGTVLIELGKEGKLPIAHLTLKAATEDARQRSRSWAGLTQRLYDDSCYLQFGELLHGEKQKAYPGPSWAKKAGMTIYHRPYDAWIFPYSGPQSEREITNEVSASLAAGESEPLTFTILAHRDFKALKVSVSEFKGDGGPFPGEVKLGVVDYGWIHNRKRIESKGTEVRECGIGPRRILPMISGEDAIPLIQDKSQRIWLTATTRPNAKPGAYKGTIQLDADGSALTVRAQIEVLPFRLPVSPIKHGFHSRAVPTQDSLEHLKSMGMQMLSISAPLGRLGLYVFLGDGKMSFDFTEVDENMRRIREAGIRGPLFLQMLDVGKELTHREWRTERRTERAKKVVIHMGKAVHELMGKGEMVSLEFFERFAREFKAIPDHAREAGWPETYFIVATNLTDVKAPAAHDYAASMYKTDPDTKLYISFTDRWRKNLYYWQGRYATYLQEYLSAWGSLAYDFDPRLALDPAVLGNARKQGLCILESQTGNSLVRTGMARFTNGFYAWAMGADGVLIWSYDDYSGTGMSDIDDWWDTASVVMGLDSDFVPIPACEGIREGVDDIRYIAALQEAAKAAGKEAEAEKLLNEIRQEIMKVIPPAPDDVRPDVEEFGKRRFIEPEQWRRRIVEAIVRMKGK